MCSSTLSSEFPEDCKFYPADTKDELHKVNVDSLYALLGYNLCSYLYIFTPTQGLKFLMFLL